jgi:hypothetical protein
MIKILVSALLIVATKHLSCITFDELNDQTSMIYLAMIYEHKQNYKDILFLTYPGNAAFEKNEYIVFTKEKDKPENLEISYDRLEKLKDLYNSGEGGLNDPFEAFAHSFQLHYDSCFYYKDSVIIRKPKTFSLFYLLQTKKPLKPIYVLKILRSMLSVLHYLELSKRYITYLNMYSFISDTQDFDNGLKLSMMGISEEITDENKFEHLQRPVNFLRYKNKEQTNQKEDLFSENNRFKIIVLFKGLVTGNYEDFYQICRLEKEIEEFLKHKQSLTEFELKYRKEMDDSNLQLQAVNIQIHNQYAHIQEEYSNVFSHLNSMNYEHIQNQYNNDCNILLSHYHENASKISLNTENMKNISECKQSQESIVDGKIKILADKYQELVHKITPIDWIYDNNEFIHIDYAQRQMIQEHLKALLLNKSKPKDVVSIISKQIPKPTESSNPPENSNHKPQMSTTGGRLII